MAISGRSRKRGKPGAATETCASCQVSRPWTNCAVVSLLTINVLGIVSWRLSNRARLYPLRWRPRDAAMLISLCKPLVSMLICLMASPSKPELIKICHIHKMKTSEMPVRGTRRHNMQGTKTIETGKLERCTRCRQRQCLSLYRDNSVFGRIEAKVI